MTVNDASHGAPATQADNARAETLQDGYGPNDGKTTFGSIAHQGILFAEGLISGSVFKAANGSTELVDHILGTHFGSNFQFSNQAEVDNSLSGKAGEVAGTAADFIGLTMVTGGAADAIGLSGYGAMAVSGGLAGAIDGGVLTPTSDTDFVKGRLLNAAIGGISGAAGIGAGAAINILADGAAGAITSTAVRMGGNMAVGAGSGAVTAEASALASDGRWATQSELSLAFATGVAGGALSIFGGAPHFAGTAKLPVSPAGPIDVAGRPVAPPEPPSAYKPEVFKDKPYEVNFNGDTRTVQPSSVTAWQTLDEGERINLGVSLNFQAGEVKGYLTHESFGSATDPVHAPISAIRDGLEVRVNGQKVDWQQQQAAGFTGPAYMEWSAPASGGPVKVDLSFYGRPIGKYSLDPTSGTLTRLEQSKQLSVLDIRQFHQQPNYAGEWQKHGVTIDNERAPANQIDLHTHFAGAMRGDTIIKVAQEVDTPYPVSLLDEAGIEYKPEAVRGFGQERTITFDPKNFPDAIELQKFETMLSIPEDQKIDFRRMEQIYKLRTPLVKDIAAFPRYLEEIAKDYQKQGVRYAELSLSDVLKPEWLLAARSVLPKIEQETGVQLRFVAGFWRHLKPEERSDLLGRIMKNSHEPEIVGVDFMGEETNKTRDFARELSTIALIRSTRPEFQIRVHAGENGNELDNIKDAIKLGATRIGHGVYGVDEETLRLARENNVIIEFNANSNVALRNIDGTGELPIKQYLNAGVRVTLGTDGHGMYRTSARSEEAVMRSLGLTDEDFAKITRSDQLYLEMMKHPERLRLRPAA